MYETIKVNGRDHVVDDATHRYGVYRNANYKKTNKALCGVLKPGQTLSDWIRKNKSALPIVQEIKKLKNESL